MERYFLIENIQDIPIFMRQRERLRDAVFVTPYASVACELERNNISVEKLSRREEWHNSLLEMEGNNRDKVIQLREAIAEYLNMLSGYAFRGCHHPDFRILCYKMLLFSFDYRYELLHQRFNIGSCKSDDLAIYVIDDLSNMEGRLTGVDEMGVTESFFPKGQRSFSNTLKWARPDIIRVISDTAEELSLAKMRRRKNENDSDVGVLRNFRCWALKVLYDARCRWRFGNNSVALVDFMYLGDDSLCVKEDLNLYRLRTYLVQDSFERYRKTSLDKEVDAIVGRVENDVLMPMRSLGIFRIIDFDYYEYVRCALMSFIRMEIASFYWADGYTSKLMTKFNILETHSDRAYNPAIYALFTLLKKRGVVTYSYPHGSEGYYDYFWQERLTTASASFRVVGSDIQKHHFEDQQRLHYKKCYHTHFVVSPIHFSINAEGTGGLHEKRYDVIYVMNETTKNRQYTIMNYPDEFDFHNSQRAIILALCRIAKEEGVSVCIRPSNSFNMNESNHLFGDVLDNVCIAWDRRFAQLTLLTKNVIMDCPTTVLFQCLMNNKKALCLNCYNNIDENLKKIMNDNGVYYLEKKNISEVDAKAAIGDFLSVGELSMSS